MENLIAQLMGGALGGMAGAKAVSDNNMGMFGNLIAGAVGGLGGGNAIAGVLSPGTATPAGLDVTLLVANLISGGIGGVVVQIIIGFIMRKMLR